MQSILKNIYSIGGVVMKFLPHRYMAERRKTNTNGWDLSVVAIEWSECMANL